MYGLSRLSEIQQEIAAVNEEIVELEELISLQRLKVKLLREKNNKLSERNEELKINSDMCRSCGKYYEEQPTVESGTSDSVQHSSSDMTPTPSHMTSLLALNEKHNAKLANTSLSKPLKNEGKQPKLIISEPENSSNNLPPESKSESESEIMSPGKKTRSIITSMNHQSVLISSVQRMSRLTTDLANERNLLAFARTAMAAVRTGLSFLALSGVTDFGDVAVKIAAIGFAVFALWAMVQGIHRYERIKHVLKLPDPPLIFHRITNRYLYFALVALFIIVLTGQAGEQWVRG